MQIACIGNYNNMLFSLTRYLRDKGYDVHLYYFHDGEPKLFHPYADSYLKQEDLDTFVFKLESYHFFDFSFNQYFKKKFAKYDFLIGSDWAPSIAQRIGRKLDIFIPHGKDIQYRHSYKFQNTIPKIWEITLKASTFFQKRGIEKSSLIIFDETDSHWEAKMTPLRLKSGQRVKTSVPMVYTPQYNSSQFDTYCNNSRIYNELKILRDDGNIIVFCHSRHEWINGGGKGLGFKGNDILIKGFADFLKTKSSKAKLVLFEYGSDVQESKSLIESLGITNDVIWYTQMNRKDIMPGICQADIVAGQFLYGFNTFGVILEGMALQKPIMNFRDDNQYKHLYADLYPLINVNTPWAISAALVDYASRPEFYKEMGVQSHKWMMKYVIGDPLNTCIDQIEKVRMAQIEASNH